MAMVVPLSANEKASRALMATEVAPMDAQATSVSSDSPQKLLENAVETIGDAVGSPLSSRAKEGDNALETLVDVAAAAGERPEGTAELLKQEPSSLATNEEDMEPIEEEEKDAPSSNQEQDPSSNAQLKTTPEKPKPASKNSPPPLSSSIKDEPFIAGTDEEEMDTSDLPSGQTTQEVYASPLSSPQKGSSRNQKYSMRTRRASCMDPSNTSDSDPTSSKRKPRGDTPTAKQPSPSPPSSPAHTDSEPDMPRRGKGRGKTRGRGGLGRGILKKTQSSSEYSTRVKQSEVTVTSKGRGRGRGRVSSTQAQSPMTRAAAAGLPVVQFLSLPRKRSKKRQGEGEGTEEDDYEDEEEEEDEEEDDSPVKPHTKKPKLEEQIEDTAQETVKTSKPADAQSNKGKLSKQKSKEPDTSSMDSTLEEEKDTSEVEQDDKTLKSPSKPVSRRGGRRGRRGGGRGAMAGASRGSRLDATPPEKSADKVDVVEITEAKKNSPMQPPTRGKRRGRPPKRKPEPDVTKSKTKEENEDSAPVADKTSRDSQEEENCEEMEEDQVKESTEIAEPAAASEDKKEQENASQDESTDNDTVSVKVEKESEEKTSTAPASSGPKPVSAGDNPVKTSSVIVSVLSGNNKPSTEAPSSSKQPHAPTHSSPGEGHFPYHPFPPIDEMHPMPPHPFISGYPPFSAPYGSFLVPSSPSYPYPPPEHYHMYAGYQEDMSYHGFPHPRAHPASLPPQPASTSTTASSSTTSSTTTSSNTTSTPAQKSESSGSGGDQPQKTSPSTPSIPPPGPSPTTPHAMEMPMCHYAPHPPASYLPSYVIPMEWSVPPHSAQRPPMMPSPTTIKPTTGTSEPRFPLNLFHDDQRSNQPVDCPECGRHFKNNKALNGHMRLHGGFDWTRKPYQAIQQMQQQQQQKDQQQQQTKEQPKPPSPTPLSDNFVREQLKQHVRDKHSNEDGKQGDEPTRKKEKEKKVPSTSSKNSSSSRKYSKEKNSSLQREEERNLHSRTGPTLDDLCRAAAELERIDSRNGMKEINSAASKKHRPGNISIPSHSSPLLHHHDRQKLTSFSPPYTPPPILSPSRSMTMLSNITSGGPATPQVPCTPNKIWQRKGSERVSESEDSFSYTEPKINVGKEFQAELPKCNPDESPADTVHKAIRVWKPPPDLTQEEEDTVDGYLELACSPVMPHAGRNKEFALHTLYQTKGSIKEAVRLLVTGKSAVSRDDPMATYNYTGSKRWTGRERQQFRHAYRVHHKHFALVRSALENKQLSEVVEYYYSWKKYCSDEYRGRNRHVSEEILSEEDETSVRPPSAASSSGSSASGDLELHSSNPSSSARYLTSGRSLHNSAGSLPHEIMEHLPRAYVPPHLLNNPPIQEHHCKYPGCNQVYTSIFALNGHIRVHGGSWYPKKNDVENGPESSGPSPVIMGYPSSSLFGSAVAPHRSRLEDRHTSHQLEVAKTMVMDLPQPRSPAHSLAAHTPSPKPSPGRVRSSLVRSRKANSSSPADRDGFYPCNRCGRVFTKVKSRSAHMKSHIVKQS